MALEVVQELPPDDDDGYDIGDVVFVLGDVPKAGGGSPAAISSENGASVERGKVIGDKTYDIYTFTDDTATDLSLTVAPDGAGLAEILVVAGGGGSGNDAGVAGYALQQVFAAGEQTVLSALVVQVDLLDSQEITHGLDRLQSQVEARGRTQTSAIRMAALMVAGVDRSQVHPGSTGSLCMAARMATTPLAVRLAPAEVAGVVRVLRQ